jgi:predicted ABC-type ATPase
MPDDLSASYEARHIRNLAKASARIREIYDKSILEISLKAKRITIQGEVFDLRKYPTLKKQIETLVKQMNASVYTTIVNGIKDSWDLSNEKNDVLVDKRLAGAKPTKKGKQILYDPNIEALKQFIARKERGMNLSDRVWRAVKSFREELEQALGIGISEGKGAIAMASEIKQFLNNPDKLFRRVRDAEGKLKLSQAAKDFHPGQGVYRSSFKNALRLTRTENNMAYRTSDNERWQALGFVVGIEIRLSNSHVFKKVNGKRVCEICECLKGEYPKDFLFRGWHPSCLCYQVPKLMSNEEYDKVEDAILAGKNADIVSEGLVTRPPKAFDDYMKANAEKIAGYKNKPYWVRDNQKFLDFGPLRSVKDFNTAIGVKDNIKTAFDGKMGTHQFYRDKAGKLTADREELHNEIIKDILDQGSTKTGTVYMLGGAPANGKSTLINSGKLPHPEGILKVDPDEIKKQLPEYSFMTKAGDKRAAAFVHEESSFIGKEITAQAFKKGYDILSDGVGDGTFDELNKKIQKIKSAGKRIRADYVSLDTDLSFNLAAERAIKTGREVPADYILEMNREISKLIPEIIEKKAIDELFLWDTNINGNPRLILSQIDGKLTVYDQDLYNRFLSKAR